MVQFLLEFSNGVFDLVPTNQFRLLIGRMKFMIHAHLIFMSIPIGGWRNDQSIALCGDCTAMLVAIQSRNETTISDGNVGFIVWSFLFIRIRIGART